MNLYESMNRGFEKRYGFNLYENKPLNEASSNQKILAIDHGAAQGRERLTESPKLVSDDGIKQIVKSNITIPGTHTYRIEPHRGGVLMITTSNPDIFDELPFTTHSLARLNDGEKELLSKFGVKNIITNDPKDISISDITYWPSDNDYTNYLKLQRTLYNTTHFKPYNKTSTPQSYYVYCISDIVGILIPSSTLEFPTKDGYKIELYYEAQAEANEVLNKYIEAANELGINLIEAYVKPLKGLYRVTVIVPKYIKSKNESYRLTKDIEKIEDAHSKGEPVKGVKFSKLNFGSKNPKFKEGDVITNGKVTLEVKGIFKEGSTTYYKLKLIKGEAKGRYIPSSPVKSIDLNFHLI